MCIINSNTHLETCAATFSEMETSCQNDSERDLPHRSTTDDETSTLTFKNIQPCAQHHPARGLFQFRQTHAHNELQASMCGVFFLQIHAENGCNPSNTAFPGSLAQFYDVNFKFLESCYESIIHQLGLGACRQCYFRKQNNNFSLKEFRKDRQHHFEAGMVYAHI